MWQLTLCSLAQSGEKLDQVALSLCPLFSGYSIMSISLRIEASILPSTNNKFGVVICLKYGLFHLSNALSQSATSCKSAQRVYISRVQHLIPPENEPEETDICSKRIFVLCVFMYVLMYFYSQVILGLKGFFKVFKNNQWE